MCYYNKTHTRAENKKNGTSMEKKKEERSEKKYKNNNTVQIIKTSLQNTRHTLELPTLSPANFNFIRQHSALQITRSQ